MATTKQLLINACLDILKIANDGEAIVGASRDEPRLIPISGFKDARSLKVGKLQRTIGIIGAAMRSQRSQAARERYVSDIRQWQRVRNRVEKITLNEARAMVRSARTSKR